MSGSGPRIDETARVDPGARIGEGVAIGAYSVVGTGVEIGDGCTIGPHVVLQGPTTLGRDNHIHAFCSVGADPQDKKYLGGTSRLVIGDGNTIREYCSINRGTVDGGGITRIGDRNWIMAYVHIAHDCQVGNDTVFANGASLAGHVTVADFAVLGGFTLVHQFCRLGAHSFTGMGTAVRQDLPPYVMLAGDPARPRGINVEGLRRRGFTVDDVELLRQAYRLLYQRGLRLAQAIDGIRRLGEHPVLQPLQDFLAASERGIAR